LTNEDGAMSAVYGAAGVLHDPTLTRLLLQAGADPNDGESLYHATEAPDAACLALLLEHGARPEGTAAVAHAIDDDKVEHVRLLLDAGADPNEAHWALLVHAVRRGCGPEMLRLLAERGAELDRRGGEWSTPRAEYRTAYQNAVLRSRDDLATLLAELGADTAVAPEDLAVAALARGEEPAGPLPARPDADATETLILAALGGRLDTIVDALGPSFRGHVGGGPPGTLLHHASWVGSADVVGRLLARGADPVARSGADYDTPLAWAALGSEHHASPGRDYVAVAEQFLAAGARLESRFTEVAEGPLWRWLQERA
jgi:ankyrin repeat protein